MFTGSSRCAGICLKKILDEGVELIKGNIRFNHEDKLPPFIESVSQEITPNKVTPEVT